MAAGEPFSRSIDERSSRASSAELRRATLRASWARPAASQRIRVSTAGSFAGDAIATVAFGVLAYRAGGPGGVALLVAAQMLPAALLVQFVSRAADRVPRERLLVAIDLSRLALAAVACVLESTGQPRVALLPFAAGLTTATAASKARCAARSCRCSWAARVDALTRPRASRRASCRRRRRQAARRSAAVLFSVANPGFVLVSAVCCFAVAALGDVGLPSTEEIAIRPQAAAGPLASSRALTVIRSHPELRLATALFAVKNLGRGALYVLVVVISLKLLHVGGPGVRGG